MCLAWDGIGEAGLMESKCLSLCIWEVGRLKRGGREELRQQRDAWIAG